MDQGHHDVAICGNLWIVPSLGRGDGEAPFPQSHSRALWVGIEQGIVLSSDSNGYRDLVAVLDILPMLGDLRPASDRDSPLQS